jgi:hypothetical protein
MTIHETPTTLGDFWDYYVAPTNRVRTLIHEVVRGSGDLPGRQQIYTHMRRAS